MGDAKFDLSWIDHAIVAAHLAGRARAAVSLFIILTSVFLDTADALLAGFLMLPNIAFMILTGPIAAIYILSPRVPWLIRTGNPVWSGPEAREIFTRRACPLRQDRTPRAGPLAACTAGRAAWVR